MLTISCFKMLLLLRYADVNVENRGDSVPSVRIFVHELFPVLLHISFHLDVQQHHAPWYQASECQDHHQRSDRRTTLKIKVIMYFFLSNTVKFESGSRASVRAAANLAVLFFQC